MKITKYVIDNINQEISNNRKVGQRRTDSLEDRP